jgi:hypothetical protein
LFVKKGKRKEKKRKKMFIIFFSFSFFSIPNYIKSLVFPFDLALETIRINPFSIGLPSVVIFQLNVIFRQDQHIRINVAQKGRELNVGLDSSKGRLQHFETGKEKENYGKS